MAGVHGPQLSDEGRALLDPARQLRWRAPEMALLFSDRAVERAAATGERGLHLRAEGLALFALNRLGRGVAATERALAAVRDAEEVGEEEIAADLRVELACAARQAGGHDAAVRVLAPVLRREQLEAAARVHALVEFVGSAQDGGERTAALDEAERLCGSTDLDRDTARILHARVSAARAGHARRVGEFDAAAEVARSGLELLGQLGDPGADSGEFRASLALERVHALLELGQRADAVRTADPVLHEPVRAASAGPVGWLRFALATRVHLLDGAPGAAVGMLGEAARSAEWFHLDDLLTETLSTLSHVHEENEDTAEALQCLRRAYAADRRWRAAVHTARLRLGEEFPASARPEGGRRRASGPTAEVSASRRAAASHAAPAPSASGAGAVASHSSGEAPAAVAASGGARAVTAESTGSGQRRSRTTAEEAVAAVEEMAREQVAVREQRAQGRGRRRQDESREAARCSTNDPAEVVGHDERTPQRPGHEPASEKAAPEHGGREHGGRDEDGGREESAQPARGRRARREESRAREAAAQLGTDRPGEAPSREQRHERPVAGRNEPPAAEARGQSPWGEPDRSSARAAEAASFGGAAARPERDEPALVDGQDTNVRDAARRLMDALTGRTGQEDGGAASAGDVPEPRVPTGERSRSDASRHHAASGEPAAAGSPGEPTFSESYRGESEASAGTGDDDLGIARGATDFPTAPKTFGDPAHHGGSAAADEPHFSKGPGLSSEASFPGAPGFSEGPAPAERLDAAGDPGSAERRGFSDELDPSSEPGRAENSWLWQRSRESGPEPTLPSLSDAPSSALPDGLVDTGVTDTGVADSALDEVVGPEAGRSGPPGSAASGSDVLLGRGSAWLDDEEPGDADLDAPLGDAGAGGASCGRPQYDSSWYDSYDADEFGRSGRDEPLGARDPLGSALGGGDRAGRDEPAGDEEARARSGKTLAEIRESLRLLQERSGTAAAARESAAQPAAQFIDPDDPLGEQDGSGGGRRHRHTDLPEQAAADPGGEPASDLLGRYGISEPEVERAPEPAAEQPAEPSEDAGLADLLAEALVAYESGRQEPGQQARSETAQPRGTASGGRRHADAETSGTGVPASRHLDQSTSDGPAPRRHRRAAADAASAQASWTPSAEAQVRRNL